MIVTTIGSEASDHEPRRASFGRRWLAAAAASLLLAIALLAVGITQRGIPNQEQATLESAGLAAIDPEPAGLAAIDPEPAGIATMPSEPVDGVLTLVVPPGAAADQQAGGRGYVMPSVINLNVGDTIVIRNDDDAPHMILYSFLLPGETDTRTFTEVGSEVYSSGCGLHAASILNFTTIFVGASEAGAAGTGDA